MSNVHFFNISPADLHNIIFATIGESKDSSLRKHTLSSLHFQSIPCITEMNMHHYGFPSILIRDRHACLSFADRHQRNESFIYISIVKRGSLHTALRISVGHYRRVIHLYPVILSLTSIDMYLRRVFILKRKVDVLSVRIDRIEGIIISDAHFLAVIIRIIFASAEA